MRVAVVGGNLQGVEVAYLAHKAGWEVFLIDKRTGAPASGICPVCGIPEWKLAKYSATMFKRKYGSSLTGEHGPGKQSSP